MNQFEYEIEEKDSMQVGFDFKGFLLKVLDFWKFILLSVLTTLAIAYYVNVRKQNIYRLDSLITIENDQNPFFTANTSISFNWGGVSGKVGSILTEIKTRSHNELVIDSLEFYKQYLREGKFHFEDVYNNAPFQLETIKERPQVLGKNIGIRFIDNDSFELFADFNNKSVNCQIYKTKEKVVIQTNDINFSKVYKFGEAILLPFFNGTINRKPNANINPGSVFYAKYLNFDSVVNQYKNAIKIAPYSKSASSVLKLSLIGKNKNKIVDFLNATSAILRKTELARKNLYATNTIKFIDSSLSDVNKNIKDVTDKMNSFRKENKFFDIGAEMLQVSEQLKGYDQQRLIEESKLTYLSSLENYLLQKTDYTKIAAPTSVGIEEVNILTSVSKITALAIERKEIEYTTQEGSVLFEELDRRIDAEKNVLLETIEVTKRTISSQVNFINKEKQNLESKLLSLPKNQQEYLKIRRNLDISTEAYDIYQAKRGEAAIVKAANISDITVIDEAKDIGDAPIGPNKSLNYMLALVMGFFIPILIVFVIYLLDNTIHTREEVERLSKISVLGLLGKSKYQNNLVAYDKPKSAIAEAFRSIRSSLKFIYGKQISDHRGKTLMVTSSVSGEGKTFTSINMATVYALSGKKTILLGLDLRKPKIFGDFNISNDNGIVNYLINKEELSNVIHSTHIENLDFLPSGPIPPNPSELLMSEKLEQAIMQLREDYDMIILDTPPLGLVTDALELSSYADATIFMIRLDYTKKGMLELINAKYKAGEVKNISYVLNFYKHKARYG